MERLKTMAILALLAALAGSIALAATGGEAEVRITARQLEDGRVEFALQQRVSGEWGARILPPSRYFPANLDHNRWLNSSPLTVTASESDAPVAHSGYTPQTVELTANDDGTLFWSARETSGGFRTALVVSNHNAYVPYSVSRLAIVCDHDAPATTRLRAIFTFTTVWDSNARMGLDDNATPEYTLGQTYASDKLQGTGRTSNDSRAHFDLPPSFIADAKRLRWMTIGAGSILNGWVSHGFDLSGVWGTPVQRNLDNCER